MTQKAGLVVLSLFAVSLITLVISLYSLLTTGYFVYHARAFEARIVEVNQEQVPQGKGSVLAYVPVVEIPGETGNAQKVKVETSSVEPSFRVGDKLHVLCSPSLRCTKDSFVERWGTFAVNFGLSLVFLSFSFLYYQKHR